MFLHTQKFEDHLVIFEPARDGPETTRLLFKVAFLEPTTRKQKIDANFAIFETS